MSLAMSPQAREAFLAEPHVGVVSIPRAARGPLAVPIWYDYEPGGAPWMITSNASLKGRLLVAADAISLVAQSEALPYRYVAVEGPFETRATTREELLRMAIRYLGETDGQAYARADSLDDSIVLTIRPRQWLSVDYGKRG